MNLNHNTNNHNCNKNSDGNIGSYNEMHYKINEGPDYNVFQEWVLQNYGSNSRTKTLTKEKYLKICLFLRGGDVSEKSNSLSKLRFWVRKKGFRLLHHDASTGAIVDDVNGDLYVSLYKREESSSLVEGSIEQFLRRNLPEISFFRKVAYVDKFYDIIKAAHVDEKGQHAGQKKTYRLVSDTHAFLPREVITYYLLNCDACKPRIHKYGLIKSKKRQIKKMNGTKDGDQKSLVPLEVNNSQKNSTDGTNNFSSSSSSSSDESSSRRSYLGKTIVRYNEQFKDPPSIFPTRKESPCSSAEDEIIDPVGLTDDRPSIYKTQDKPHMSSHLHFLPRKECKGTHNDFYHTTSYYDNPSHQCYHCQTQLVYRPSRKGANDWHHLQPYHCVSSGKTWNRLSRRGQETASLPDISSNTHYRDPY